ncbi:ammonium transport protein AmtB [Candidatus Scalindua japonica]|uniref:Ammonium transporter n=2 Tax=Candidatus Scalindua japonica TaxID=1284222 RepID=A0A286TTS3_9BACT|nr:ammonium transport protein AmtB [Candidatus Scalindua japonica]
MAPVIIMSSLLFFTILHSAEASDIASSYSVHSSDVRDITGVKISIDLAWTLLCGFLVFNMQAGFAFLGAGFLQKKNTLNYLTMSFMDFCVGGIIFWSFGFALMFGGSHLGMGLDAGNMLVGFSGFFLSFGSFDFSTSQLWLFQMMFSAAACTIVAGAVAERIKFNAHVICSIVLSGIIYPIYGHWVWGGGWLANLPFGSGLRDFAGSGVVHGIGGLIALVGAWMVGPRFGKYNPDGTPNMFHGHNLSFVVLGTLFLLFGWFGFNAGSTLGSTDLRVSIIAANTFLAACAGGVSLMYITYYDTGKYDIVMTCNGTLAGCVAITASGAYVSHWAAVVIGIIAVFILKASLHFVENKLRIDDPVGAISVHGANGLWGLLSVGIFADGSYLGVKGLITGSGWQLLSQFIGCVVLLVWTLGLGFILFYIIKKTIGLRVPVSEENTGIDLYEHGIPCYPGFN